MSDLTVRTTYTDISDLAEAYAQRVDDARIMLPAPQPFTDGSWVQFVVMLADGSSALEGGGRVQQTLDNGAAFPAEERYDIVLEQLQLEARAEVVFERIVLASQAGSRADPPTGEIALDQVNAIEESVAGDEEATYAGEGEEYAEEADVEQMPSQRPPAPVAAQPRPAAAARPAPASPPPMTGLSRPSKGSQWYPDLPERPDPRPSSGYFQYGQGVLPQPARPPRPDLPEERRIRPAPKPTNGQTGASYPAAARGGQDLIPTIQADIGGRTGEHDMGEHAQDMDFEDPTSHSIKNPNDDGDEEV